MIAQPQPLSEVCAAIPDLRRGRGKRPPWPAMLSLACGAMLCGYRSYSALAAWGRNDGTRIAQALGFTPNTPCAATLHTGWRHVDRDAVEAKVGAWAEGGVGASTPGAPSAGAAALALDGKPRRGARQQGAPGVPLVSALSHHVGLTLAQQGVDDTTHEITQGEPVLHQRVLQGRVGTMDALLTPRQGAQTIVEQGGDSVMLVTENQPQLRADIAFVLTVARGRPSRDRPHRRYWPWAQRAAPSYDPCGPRGL
jgi:DDE family transposase